MTFRRLLCAFSTPILLVSFTAVTAAAPPAKLVAQPAAPPVQEAAAPPAGADGVLVGPVTREKVEAVPDWMQAEVDARPDPAAAAALAAVEPGAEVTVYFGSWCSDSRRELPRFWKALDAAGGSVPFEIRYVAVDRQKQEPAAALAKDGVRYVPTFIVRRDGREVGRVVETSPKGIESDLLALLTGQAHGVLSTRDDLRQPAPPSPKRSLR
jgi:thiol-disulfide isomerase/thioredoxin